MTDEAAVPRLARYESRVEVPLLVAALAFLVAFALPILWWPAPDTVVVVCEIVVWVTWGLFAIDYVARLIMADDRRRYALAHWYDLLIIALPALRPLRLLRLVTFLSLVNRRASSNFRGRVGAYVGCGAALLALIGSLAVLDAERTEPDANILSFWDALWWSVTTMTTVGYGDRFPVTDIGRIVAVGLMVCGIAILGTVTATLASWIVERVNDDASDTHAMLDELRALRAEVAQLRADSVGKSADARPGPHQETERGPRA